MFHIRISWDVLWKGIWICLFITQVKGHCRNGKHQLLWEVGGAAEEFSRAFKLENIGLETCQDMCLETSRCRAIKYDTVASRCFLQSDEAFEVPAEVLLASTTHYEWRCIDRVAANLILLRRRRQATFRPTLNPTTARPTQGVPGTQVPATTPRPGTQKITQPPGGGGGSFTTKSWTTKSPTTKSPLTVPGTKPPVPLTTRPQRPPTNPPGGTTSNRTPTPKTTTTATTAKTTTTKKPKPKPKKTTTTTTTTTTTATPTTTTTKPPTLERAMGVNVHFTDNFNEIVADNKKEFESSLMTAFAGTMGVDINRIGNFSTRKGSIIATYKMQPSDKTGQASVAQANQVMYSAMSADDYYVPVSYNDVGHVVLHPNRDEFFTFEWKEQSEEKKGAGTISFMDAVNHYPEYVVLVGMGIVIILLIVTAVCIICVLSSRRHKRMYEESEKFDEPTH